MIEVKAGDYGYKLYFQVLEVDGTAKDLNAYDVFLRVWDRNGDEILYGACNLDTEQGICYYTVQQEDFGYVNTNKDYNAEIELVKKDGTQKISTETFILRVLVSP